MDTSGETAFIEGWSRTLRVEGSRNVTDDIWVAFGCDSAFAPHAAAVVTSIVRNAPNASFHFLFLQEGFDAEQQRTLEALAPSSAFTWADMTMFELPEYKIANHISHATLFRLGLEQLAPQACKRLIYLDADLIVLGDLQKLWNVDLQGALIGAVPDAVLNSSEPELVRHWLDWGLAPDGTYLNAGVLIIDLQKVREERAFSKALSLIAKHGSNLPYQDQDAINWVFWKRWHPLPLEWNVQTVQFLTPYREFLADGARDAGQNPNIVHYTGPAKPWSANEYHPLSWLYWDVLAHTPYLDQVREKNGITRWMMFRHWLRWLKRRPLAAFARANFPSAVSKARAKVKPGPKIA